MPTWGARVGEGRCERGRLTRFGCLRRVRGLETVLQALSKDLQNDPGMPDPCGALGTLTRESKKVPNFTYTLFSSFGYFMGVSAESASVPLSGMGSPQANVILTRWCP